LTCNNSQARKYWQTFTILSIDTNNAETIFFRYFFNCKRVKMWISYSFVFELIALFLTSNCAIFFGNLDQPQSELLDKFKPCIIRIVFLENSISASKNVLSFLQYYQNQGTFILDSIPASSKDYNTDTKQATTRHRDIRFMPRSAIFYFQDEFFDAAKKNKELPTMAILHYFRTFAVFQRNENPAFIVFITFNSSPVSSMF